MIVKTAADLLPELKKYFGFEKFRPGQFAPIQALLNGKHVIATLPTGSGKSLIYQLAGYKRSGLVLIVSPLVALMEDQVARLKYMGEKRAAFLNSSQTNAEKALVLHAFKRLKFLFLSPEMLQKSSIQLRLKNIKLSLLVIDEAHCISQWGRDFRFDYLALGTLREKLHSPLTLALTATATATVIHDIQTVLRLPVENTAIFQGPVDRDNIYYEVRQVRGSERQQQLLQFVTHISGPGIVYFSSKKVADSLRDWLAFHSTLQIETYHADRSKADRLTIQHQFLQGELDLICATSAFGMGIDKADIRYVVHYHIPGSMEEYVQEVGRAGRDQQKAQACLFYDAKDVLKRLRWMAGEQLSAGQIRSIWAYQQSTKNTAVFRLSAQQTTWLKVCEQARFSPQQAAQFIQKRIQYKQQLLEQMQQYCESKICRREQINRYFGHRAPALAQDCCDVCQPEGIYIPFFRSEHSQLPENWSARLAVLFNRSAKR